MDLAGEIASQVGKTRIRRPGRFARSPAVRAGPIREPRSPAAFIPPTSVKISSLLLVTALLAAPLASARAGTVTPLSDTALAALARSHEQVFQSFSGDAPISVVLQRGDKQFVISGVTHVRAVGSVAEIAVNNGRKYSVSAGDIFFITNDTFGLK